MKNNKLNGQKHIINRQVLEINIPERGHVQPIQNKASEIIKQKLHPALDILFSKMTGSDEIIRIDKMIIDLGTISENELGSLFVEKTVKEISNKISKLKNSGSKYSEKKSVNGSNLDSDEKVVVTTKSKDLLERFVFFLLKGHFPWWHKLSAKNNLEETFTEALKYETALFRNAIIPLLRYPSVRQRLVFQLNHSQLYALFEKMNYQLIKSYFTLFQVLLSLIKTAQKRKEITGRFYEIALQYFSTEQELENEDLKIGFIKDIIDLYLTRHSVAEKETILADIIHSLQLREIIETPNDANLTMVALIMVSLELPSQNQHLHGIIQDLLNNNGVVINKLVKKRIKKINRKIVKKRKGKNAESTDGMNYPAANGRGNENPPHTLNMPRGEGDSTQMRLKSEREKIFTEKGNDTKETKSDKSNSLFPPKSSNDSDEIIISNAGLVLIHPFLRYFFQGLNLLDKDLKFKSKTDIFKAIHLMQFLVTGQEKTIESDLVLNKILCGLDITEPVPKNVLLLEEEKQECTYLLATVLERWEALKTKNPKALRETYLQREGILKQSGESWNLIIERNSFDVMLEKLPWSINLIKLPWLSQILYVEW